MPHPCVVCGRSRMNPNNREEDYMFFGFPVNYEERCRKWLEFCCREDLYKLTKKQLLQRMVCSKHFEKKDFLNEYQDRLNCTGVPSIYDPSQSLYNITCVLCGRSRKDPPDSDYDGTTFHHFPGEEFRCLKWLDFVGIDSYYRLTRKEILYCYICSNHFEKTQFMTGFKARLCDNAVPSIYLDEETNELIRLPLTSKGSSSTKASQIGEKIKYEPLSNDVLESQACAACGRSRSDPRNKIEGYKFHPFPAYEIGRCLRWCQFLGREDLLKMSPNQIRKLVLCSKHFLTGQTFHKVGPCDAVPTIKDINDLALMDKSETSIEKYEHEENDNDDNIEIQLLPSQDSCRPMVSSKKPKVENKPAPLAKKRGRSKRPTSINIPKIDHLNIENRVSKVPIPATNWKIQFANNQFQPLTIANTNSPSMAITSDGKKVILPFTGNISNLGAPIPVHSLSSMPPGFLIKIDLPEQQAQANKKPVKASRKQAKRTKAETDVKVEKADEARETKIVRRRRTKKSNQEANDLQNIEDILTVESHQIVKPEEEFYVSDFEEPEEEMMPDVIEVLDEDYVKLEDSYVGEDEDGEVHVYQEVPVAEIPPEEGEIPKVRKLKKRSERSSMSARTRKTIMPIRTEVRHFLHKLKPYMSRLPRKTKAQLKLSIVNLVIDHL